MNSETTILVGIVLAVIILAAVYGVVSGGIDRAGEALFGEGQEGEGFLQPQEGDDGGYSFPQPEDQSRDRMIDPGGVYDSV